MTKYRVTFNLQGAWEEWLVESDAPDFVSGHMEFLDLLDGGNDFMQPIVWEKVED